MRLILLSTLLISFQAFAQEACIEVEDLQQLPNTIPIELPGNQNHDLSQEIRTQASTTPGGWSGNGGDFGEVSNNIWNLGSEEISYCIISSSDFSINRNSLINLVDKSFLDWKSFFSKYDLLNPIMRNTRNRRRTINFADDKNRGVNFNYKLSQECKSSSLTFYFGTENKLIKDYKKYATEHPYGFALRTSYNHRTYKNNGLIWIKTSDNNKQIKEVLLHEIGHVLGMKHDSVYIMRSSMAKEIEEGSFNKLANKVETQAWPYRFSDNSSIFLKPTGKQKRNNCEKINSFKAGKNTQMLKSMIETSAKDCLILELTSQGQERKVLKLQYKLSNLTTGKEITLNGRFITKRKLPGQKKGPGVFSKFKVNTNRGEKLVWKKISLDRHDNNEISGSFKTKNSYIPAKLLQEKGVMLDLYLPKVDSWITFKSVQ